jgi:hypothetical protein
MNKATSIALVACSSSGQENRPSLRLAGRSDGNRSEGDGRPRLGLGFSIYFGGRAMKMCMHPRAVHVRAYVRYRFNRFEHVCEHCRSFPGQLILFG